MAVHDRPLPSEAQALADGIDLQPTDLFVYEDDHPLRKGWSGDTPNREFHAARHGSRDSIVAAHERYVEKVSA